MTPDPTRIFHGLEPYKWAEWADEHYMTDTPDITYVHWDKGAYNIPGPATAATELLYLGMLQRIYGDTQLYAQEN